MISQRASSLVIKISLSRERETAREKKGKRKKRKRRQNREAVCSDEGRVDRAKASRSFFDRNKNRRCLIFVCVKEGISRGVKGGQWQKASPRTGVGLVWESSQTAWPLISIPQPVTRSFLINFLIVIGLCAPSLLPFQFFSVSSVVKKRVVRKINHIWKIEEFLRNTEICYLIIAIFNDALHKNKLLYLEVNIVFKDYLRKHCFFFYIKMK